VKKLGILMSFKQGPGKITDMTCASKYEGGYQLLTGLQHLVRSTFTSQLPKRPASRSPVHSSTASARLSLSVHAPAACRPGPCYNPRETCLSRGFLTGLQIRD
jgi:hypothetical protein